MMKKIKVAVVGSNGYIGQEAANILARHPNVDLTHLIGFSSVGKKLDLKNGGKSRPLEALDKLELSNCDVIFACLPHGEAVKYAPEWIGAGKTVFDLSADFRLKDAGNYAEWYHAEHPAPSLLKKAVYGMPEIYADKIKTAKLVACPGCYPTATILGMLPALKKKLVKPQIFVSAISGTSGAGIKSDHTYSFCEVNENVSVYSFPNHRHTPEMEQELSTAAKQKVTVSFVPHLGPFNRGIHATVTADMSDKKITQQEVDGVYHDFYAKQIFTRAINETPQLKDVRNTNYCLMRPIVDARTGRLVVLSVIDNLVKGAAGQAVQCLNIRFGFKEGAGLYMKPARI